MAEQLATAAAVLGLVTWIVRPRNNAAAIIQAQAQGLQTMIRVATEVRRRDPEIIPVIREMTPAERARATAGLTAADKEWINTQLAFTDPLIDE